MHDNVEATLQSEHLFAYGERPYELASVGILHLCDVRVRARGSAGGMTARLTSTCSAFSVRRSPTNHSVLDGSPLGSSKNPRNTMLLLAGVPLIRRVDSCTKRQFGSVWFSRSAFCKFFLQSGCNLPIIETKSAIAV